MTMDEQTKGEDGAQTQAGQETLQAGSERTSAADAVTSKIEEGKQYGGAEVRKLIQDALSADGREQKRRADAAEAQLRTLKFEHDGLKTTYNTISDQVSQLMRAQDEAEAEKVKDNPVALDSLRARQANRAEQLRLQGEKTRLEAEDARLKTERDELSKNTISLNIKLSAMAAGVDEKELSELVPDGNPDRLNKAANILKQRGQANTQQLDEQGRVKVDKDGKEIPAALRIKPASAVSTGGDSRSLSARLLEKAKAKK
jgi:hypothetical protein